MRNYRAERPSWSHRPDKLMRSIIFLIDSSGSMDELFENRRKIDCVSDSLTALLSNPDILAEDDEVGIMLFHATRWGDVPRIDVVMPMKSILEIRREMDKLLRKLQLVKPIGGTPISFGIDQALNALSDSMASDRRIILITDGENNVGEPPQRSAQRAKEMTVKIDVIGLGEEINPLELSEISEITGGVFEHVKREEELAKTLSMLLKRLSMKREKIRVREGDELDRVISNLKELDSELSDLSDALASGKISSEEYWAKASELEFRKRELLSKMRDLRSAVIRRLTSIELAIAAEENQERLEGLRMCAEKLRDILRKSEEI